MTGRAEQLSDSVTLFPGDCLDVLKTLPANSTDACVTDPPYGLSFMGKAWDHGVPGVAYWKAVFRVLKPGAHLLAFGGTRTQHRMVCGIEDAGFEIRDLVAWLYGQGFSKSGYVSYVLEATLCERRNGQLYYHDSGEPMRRVPPFKHPDADDVYGLAGALKPALEPVCVARKPLSESTLAANVLKWGTGALNIDGCRVASGDDDLNGGTYSGSRRLRDVYTSTDSDPNAAPLNRLANGAGEFVPPLGRWPANVIHDGSDEVVGAFPESVARPVSEEKIGVSGSGESRGMFGMGSTVQSGYRDSETSASRFFYTAKADSDDRLGSKHPTVKPLDLMQYLVRLVTPPKGLVLDPFAGTGTTGEACIREGFRAVLIERESEYQNDIRRRMKLAMAGPDERARESIKEKMKGKPVDHGPLFGGECA